MTTHHRKLNVKTQADTLWVGIDVAKGQLQVHLPQPVPGLHGRLPYDKASLKKLVRHLARDARHHVIFEATGGYDKPLFKALQADGIRCSMANPRRVRDFARSEGILAKTDKIDAAVLAAFGAEKKPIPASRHDPSLEELRNLVAYRRHLMDELGREQMQLEHVKPAVITALVKARVKTLKAQITKLEALINRHIAAHPPLQRKITAMTEVKGVGTLGAAGLLAAMPELGSINRNQAAALAGLAPMNSDSGDIRGRRVIQGGRIAARHAIYMGALSASKHNEVLAPVYRSMVARGKPKKVALVAIMRRLLIHLNSILSKLLEEEPQATPASP